MGTLAATAVIFDGGATLRCNFASGLGRGIFSAAPARYRGVLLRAETLARAYRGRSGEAVLLRRTLRRQLAGSDGGGLRVVILSNNEPAFNV